MTGTGRDLLAYLIKEGLISPADLVGYSPSDLPDSRTHLEHLPRALEACPPRSRVTYKTNFNRLAAHFGDRPLASITTADLDSFGRRIEADSVAAGGLGVGALASFIHASRLFYRVAVTDGVIASNPAMALAMPQRRRRVRRALTEAELVEVFNAVVATSRDVALDVLLLEFHRETAARRGGAVNLRLSDLNLRRRSVLLREKGGHEREVPISRDLLTRINRLAADRPAPLHEEAAFRYPNGNPLTRRRYNTIFEHVQAALPWAKRLGVSTHFYRHTTLSDIAAVAGTRVAAAYAGHLDSSVTDIYTVPTFEDLQAAHRLVFGDG